MNINKLNPDNFDSFRDVLLEGKKNPVTIVSASDSTKQSFEKYKEHDFYNLGISLGDQYVISQDPHQDDAGSPYLLGIRASNLRTISGIAVFIPPDLDLDIRSIKVSASTTETELSEIKGLVKEFNSLVLGTSGYIWKPKEIGEILLCRNEEVYHCRMGIYEAIKNIANVEKLLKICENEGLYNRIAYQG